MADPDPVDPERGRPVVRGLYELGGAGFLTIGSSTFRALAREDAVGANRAALTFGVVVEGEEPGKATGLEDEGVAARREVVLVPVCWGLRGVGTGYDSAVDRVLEAVVGVMNLGVVVLGVVGLRELVDLALLRVEVEELGPTFVDLLK